MKNKFKTSCLKIYRNLSIKNKLVLLFCIQIIIPILFLSITFFWKFTNIIKNNSIEYSTDILKMIELRMEDLNSNIDSISLQLIYDDNLYYFVKKNINSNNLTYYNYSSDTRNALRDTVLSRNEIQSVCVINNNKNMIYYDYNNSSKSIKNITNFDELYEKSKQANGQVLWQCEEINGEEYIFATRAIFDRDSFKSLGVIVFLIDKDYVSSVYKDLSEDSSNNISILSQENKEIIGNASNLKYMKNFDEYSSENSKGNYIDNDSDLLISFVTIESTNWKIVYHIPLNDLYEEVNLQKKWMVLILIWTGVLVYFLSSLTSFDIVKPINSLVEGMKKVENGDKHEDIILCRKDELGYLSNSFNNMSQRIDNLVNRVYNEELTRKEAEISALQAQINPHFLFNTLENINWMAQLKGVPEISETVTSLAEIMEANIGRDDKLIPLSEEIKYIDNFISIIKSRYGDRLIIKNNIEDEVLNYKIPRLLIQPLVENAIYHGIDKVRRVGVININAYKKDKLVYVEIIDNGLGMDKEELISIQNKFKNDNNRFIKDKNNNRKSVGVMNVNRRIKLFYGNEYGLKIESIYNEYTKVTVIIPENIIEEGGFSNV